MSQQQRDALDQLLRDAPLDLGGAAAIAAVLVDDAIPTAALPAAS